MADFPMDVAVKSEPPTATAAWPGLGPRAWPGLGPAGVRRYRGLGWALRACDGARADELSKDYRALRT